LAIWRFDIAKKDQLRATLPFASLPKCLIPCRHSRGGHRHRHTSPFSSRSMTPQTSLGWFAPDPCLAGQKNIGQITSGGARQCSPVQPVSSPPPLDLSLARLSKGHGDNPHQCDDRQKNCCHRNKLKILKTDRWLEVVVDRPSMRRCMRPNSGLLSSVRQRRGIEKVGHLILSESGRSQTHNWTGGSRPGIGPGRDSRTLCSAGRLNRKRGKWQRRKRLDGSGLVVERFICPILPIFRQHNGNPQTARDTDPSSS
jgi:hypothetical protein